MAGEVSGSIVHLPLSNKPAGAQGPVSPVNSREIRWCTVVEGVVLLLLVDSPDFTQCEGVPVPCFPNGLTFLLTALT